MLNVYPDQSAMNYAPTAVICVVSTNMHQVQHVLVHLSLKANVINPAP